MGIVLGKLYNPNKYVFFSLKLFIKEEFIKIKYGIYPKLFYKKINLEGWSLSSVLPLLESLSRITKNEKVNFIFYIIFGGLSSRVLSLNLPQQK